MFFRRFLLTLLAMIVAVPFLIWGAGLAVRNMRNSPILWIPETHPKRVDYQWLLDHFEAPDALVISWPDCTVDDERLQKFSAAILDAGKDDSGELFARVLTGYDVVRALEDELRLSRGDAEQRLRAILVGPKSQSCAIVTVTDYGTENRVESLDVIRQVAAQECGVTRDQLFLGGPGVDRVAIDAESKRSIIFFMPPCALLVLLLSRVCLRSWPLTLAVVTVAGFGEILVLGLVFYFGATMNAVLTVMAPLVFVLTVSGGVHLVNYYHDEVRLEGQPGAPRRALAIGWAPCSMAALTTAIGLGSLMVSEMTPVSQFGSIGAVGVLVTVVLLFLVLPGVMDRWPVNARSPEDNSPDSLGVWQAPAGIINTFCWPIVIVCVGVLVYCGMGLSKLTTSISVLNLLAPESRTVHDYHWLEDNIGPLIPIEVVVTFPEDSKLLTFQKIHLIRHIETALAETKTVEGAMSASTWLPPAARGVLGRSAIGTAFDNRRDKFIEGGYLAGGSGEQSWRITTRVSARGNMQYGEVLGMIDNAIARQLNEPEDVSAETAAEYARVKVMSTGMMPLVHVAQTALLNDLFVSFLTALVLVSIVMVVVLRSVVVGVMAMVPNIFPTAILFGTMGWLDKPVDIGSMMTASVALGIAVDGTLHYLTWFRRELDNGRDPTDAMGLAFRHCAMAMTQTTIICGLGLLVFSLSAFVPTQRFAWMMFALLLAALVGDLVLLPALLVGPFRGLISRSQPSPVGEPEIAAGHPAPPRR